MNFSPRLLLEQALGLAAIGGLAYWWLGWPEGSVPQLLVSVLAIAIMLAGTVALALRGRSLVTGQRKLGAVIGLVVCGIAAIALINWVPGVSGFRAQATSIALRFGAAYLLFVVAWVSLLALTSGGNPRSTQESTAARP